MLQVEPVAGRGRMKGEQRQLPRIPGSDEPRSLARAHLPAKRRHRSEGALDGAQNLDKLVSDQERLAVEALDQLAQPVDLEAVDVDRILVALTVDEAVRDLRALAGR